MAGAVGFGNTFIDKVLGIPKAQLAFRPWWHEMEDYLVYSLVMTGIILAPTTMALKIGTIMDCNLCKDHFCGIDRMNKDDPKFSWKYVRKWCADNAIDPSIRYFPIIILIEAALIFGVERFFRKVTSSGDKMLKFYSHVVKDTVSDDIGQEEEEEEEREKIKASEYIAQLTVYHDDANIFNTMMARTFTELFIIICFVGWIFSADSVCPISYNHGDTNVDYCELKTSSSNTSSYWYECSGQPTGMYRFVGFPVALLNGLHILTSLYHLLWMTITGFSKWARLVTKIRSLNPNLLVKLSKARDVKLLVKLLAERTGVPAALQVLCCLDHQFLKSLSPRLRYVTESKVEITIRNPEILQLLSEWDPIYVLEAGDELRWCPATGVDSIDINGEKTNILVRLVMQARTISTFHANNENTKEASKETINENSKKIMNVELEESYL